ncbi:MAG: hypothetical protein IKX31_03960 [Muribaculaceae bacterium]|nr:hypothetical protein [Muribaculaceae bacterium]
MKTLRKIGLIIGGFLYTIVFPCLMTLLISVPYLWMWETHSFWVYMIMFVIEFGFLIYLLIMLSMISIKSLRIISDLEKSLNHFTATLMVFGVIMIAIVYGCSIYYLFTTRPFEASTFNLIIVSIAHAISFFLSFLGFED